MTPVLDIGFPTCAHPTGDEAIRGILERSVDHLLDEFGGRGLLSIILSGAMTQGEGTVLERADGSLTVLSDMDLYLVMDKDADLPLLKRQASRAARTLRSRFTEEELASSFDLAAVSVREIASVDERIGTVDLRNRGRVVWGRDVLAGLPPLDPGRIPAGNAVTLLFNRICEELFHRAPQSSGAMEMAIYHSVKTGADLALAILVLLGRYRPTYRERVGELETLWGDSRLEFLRDRAPDLPERIRRWTEQKISPDPGTLGVQMGTLDPREIAEQLWLSLVPAVEAVWTWAVRRWTGTACEAPVALAREIGKMDPIRDRLRGWRNAVIQGDAGPGVDGFVRAARGARFGSPVSLLYGAASLVYFASPGRNGLSGAGPEGEEYLAVARSLMPIPCPAGAGWDEIRRALVDHWRATVMRGMR